VQQKNVLERKLAREEQMAAVPTLDLQLLELARTHGRLTVAMAVKALGKNRNTVKLHLAQLAAQGRLRRQGRGRGAWYQRV
jgi:predicted ArsR family transcriptional regulator